MTTFALDLSKAIEKVKDKQELLLRKVVIDLFSSVVQMSPVDTGRFRANWNIGYRSPDISTSDSTDASGSAKQGEIVQKVSGMKLSDASVFLTNSLPYAQRLEEGYSGQAPQGMVRLSIINTTRAYS